MTTTKRIGKQLITALLALVLAVSMLPAFSQAAKAEEMPSSFAPAYFYVPEAIYLEPDLNAANQTGAYYFQWFVDSTIDPATHKQTLRTGEQKTGNLYFYYENAKDIRLSMRFMDLDGKTKNDNGYANIDGTNMAIYPGSARAYAGNSINTALYGGKSCNLAANESGAYIEWTVTFVDTTDNLTKTAVAHTYLYKPMIQPVGGVANVDNFYWDNFYNSHMSWISGIHSIEPNPGGDVRFPRVTNGGRGLLPFASSHENWNKVGDLYVQFPGYLDINTDNSGGDHWLEGSSSYFKIKSFKYSSDDEHNPSSCKGNTCYAGEAVRAPRSYITVDCSRYSNMNQIPDLSCGMMVTDDEDSADSTIYELMNPYKGLTRAHECWASFEQTESYETHNWRYEYDLGGWYFKPEAGCEVMVSNGSVKQEFNYYGIAGMVQLPQWNDNGTGDEIKYLGKWNNAIPGSWHNKTGWIFLTSIYWNHEDKNGGDESLGRVTIPVQGTFNNKAKLRSAVENAQNHMSKFSMDRSGNSAYYDSSSSEWTTFRSLYNSASEMLTALDFTPVVSVNGTKYTTCDAVADALNKAIAALDAAGVKHEIYTEYSAGGFVSAPATGIAKKAVAFKVNAQTGYTLETLEIKDEKGNSVSYTGNDGSYEFTMPDSIAVISAEFKKDHVHKYELTFKPLKEATCTEDGNAAYYICSCGKWFWDADAESEIENEADVIAHALGHDICIEWAFDKENHWHVCSRCDYTEGVEEHTSSGEATEEDAETCTICDYMITPPLGHIHTNHLTAVEEKEATCEEAGNYAYYECSCGAFFEDDKAEAEIEDHESVIIPALGHDIAAEWSIDEESHWYACSRCDYKDSLSKHLSSGPATEEAAEICTVCDYEINPKLEHYHTKHLVKVDAVEETCTEDGNIEYYTCKCGKWFEDVNAEIEIEDHDSVIIPALGHDIVNVPREEATCTEFGNTDGSYCARCEEVMQMPFLIPPTGHTDDNKDQYCDTCGLYLGYNIIEGAEGQWTYNSPEGYRVVSDAPNEDYPIVYVDDIRISRDDFTAEGEGTTIVTLLPEYLNSITPGAHSLKIASKDAYAESSFEIRLAQIENLTLSKTSYTYTGKAITPVLTVKDEAGTVLTEGEDYIVSGNRSAKNAGSYKVTITGTGKYTGTFTESYKINKATPKMVIKTAARTVSRSAIAKKAALLTSIKVTGAQGKVTYKKVAGKNYLKVNSKTGKVTMIKHSCQTHTAGHVMKVKVTCAGNANYKPVSKIVTVVVKMKK